MEEDDDNGDDNDLAHDDEDDEDEDDDGIADDDYGLWMTRTATLKMTMMMNPDLGSIKNTSGQTRLHQIKDM